MTSTETGAGSTASVVTDRPARYGKQLIAHLTRRSTGEWNENSDTGWLQFDAGRADLRCAQGVLLLSLDADPAQLARYEDVIGRHLVRFGARAELSVEWVRADGTPGTSYRNDDAEPESVPAE